MALVQRDKFRLVTLVNDEKIATFRQLEWNPHTEFLIAYEINPRAMLPDYNASLAPNFVPNEEIPQSQPTVMHHPLQGHMHHIGSMSKDDSRIHRMAAKNKLFGDQEFEDELEDRVVPAARALFNMTLSNWILIPIQLAKREFVTQGWGYSGAHQISELPPRLMWFDYDWSLAKCHRVILNCFMHLLIAGLEGEEPVPTYDEVFGLNDPREPMRHGFDDINETSVPFVVNVVNPDKDQDNFYSS